jgi:RNA polymerase sigma factor (sigma-70 family)
MREAAEAERYLLEEIRRGSGEAWSQLVNRYQGRLTAFARRRVPKGIEAEDLVQDTLLNFLKGLAGFRHDASVETYLFLILRRRIADLHRGRGEPGGLEQSGNSSDAGEPRLPASADHTASWYARRDEQRETAQAALTGALWALLNKMRDDVDLRDLKILELVFYAQWPNQRIAAELNENAGHVALLKHRWLKELARRVMQALGSDPGGALIPWDTPELLDSLLTEIWESERLSCPKRSTIGGFVLETLDEPWRDYVDFHLNRLDCSVCRANLEDLQEQSRQDPAPLHQRIMQSSIGFFRKT